MIFLLQKVQFGWTRSPLRGMDYYNYDLIQSYMQRKLTFDTDRLDAFATVLKAIERSRGSKFLFGFPEDIIDHILLWMPSDIDYPKSRNQAFLSWSWTS